MGLYEKNVIDSAECRFKRESNKNIVLAGLVYDSNLGDRAIYECSLKMVREIFREQNQSCEIRTLDLYGRADFEDVCSKDTISNKIWRKIRNLADRRSTEEKICAAVMCEYERIVDKDTCGIIFVGGGLIKFSHQIIAQPMRCILEKANCDKIPVMLSAVGVEGYDQDSDECEKLKSALNLNCVKIITTRDDFDTLMYNYVENKDIKIAKVADPACQISKIYSNAKVKNRSNSKKVIGLGISRFDLFSDYGKSSNREKIISLWKDIYSELERRGYDCLLFTNGLGADHQSAEELKIKLNSKNVRIAKRPQNMEELTSIFSYLDGAITTRLHASIIAYSYDIPTVGLIWNEKQRMFGEAIHHSERFMEEPFQAGMIVNQLELAMKENDGMSEDYCATTRVWLKKFLHECI